jgi:hypothetical protein
MEEKETVTSLAENPRATRGSKGMTQARMGFDQ